MDKEKKRSESSFTNAYELPEVITKSWLEDKFGEPGSAFWIWGFSMRDLSACQFAPDVTREQLMKISFDENTAFPAHLPDGYIPEEIRTKAFGPCLFFADLHKLGITGKGIKVAIIDTAMNPLHQEFIENIEYVEFAATPLPHFHGLTVAANLTGKNIGVAPGVKLIYYSRSQMSATSDTELVNALKDVVKRNESGERIRVVSLSMPYPLTKKEEYYKLMDTLKKQECTVIDSDPGFSRDFQCGRFENSNVNDPEDVVLNEWQKEERYRRLTEGKIVVPSAGRMVPLWGTVDRYQYCAQGGASWSIPMIAGLFALSLQVKPDLTYDEFCTLARETATRNKNALDVINPQGIIESL